MDDVDLLLDDRAQRWAVGDRIKRASDVRLPQLTSWNYGPCPRHEQPDPLCPWKQCGGNLLIHQRIGVAWLYAMEQGILADKTGLGKTLISLGLCALIKDREGLGQRAVVVCQASSVLQWVGEFQRFAPGIRVEAAVGTAAQRRQRYVTGWEVMVISSNMLIRDIDMLDRLGPQLVIADDVDALRHLDTATATAFDRLAYKARRVVVINATPLQTRLQDLYAHTVFVGGRSIFGSGTAFETRYVRQEPVTIYNRKTGRKITKTETVGYKNMREFKAKIAPIVLRRSYDDVPDTDIPTVAPPQDVWLELHPDQRRKYAELQRGVLRIMREQGTEVRSATAGAQFMYGSQVCAGLPALGEPDGPRASSKLDWLMTRLCGEPFPTGPASNGDWSDEKVVVFSRFKGTVTALEARCARAGIGVAKVWGEQTAEEKAVQQKRFWEDPGCRVLVGTSSIERSLNLQVANLLVNIDLLLNPARMLQILGRVRRVGSRHRRVHVFNLLARDSQEERYLAVLEARQAVADHVFDEDSGLFEQLSPLHLLQLIRPGS